MTDRLAAKAGAQLIVVLDNFYRNLCVRRSVHPRAEAGSGNLRAMLLRAAANISL